MKVILFRDNLEVMQPLRHRVIWFGNMHSVTPQGGVMDKVPSNHEGILPVGEPIDSAMKCSEAGPSVYSSEQSLHGVRRLEATRPDWHDEIDFLQLF